jgi:hypothetical protein
MSEDTPLARQAVEKFLQYVREGRFDEVADLFADDAIFMTPHGTITGRDNIKKFHSAVRSVRPRPEPVSITTEGNRSVLEFQAHVFDQSDDIEPFTMVDHFTVNEDGKVIRMAVYQRPNEVEKVQKTFSTIAETIAKNN